MPRKSTRRSSCSTSPACDRPADLTNKRNPGRRYLRVRVLRRVFCASSFMPPARTGTRDSDEYLPLLVTLRANVHREKAQNIRDRLMRWGKGSGHKINLLPEAQPSLLRELIGEPTTDNPTQSSPPDDDFIVRQVKPRADARSKPVRVEQKLSKAARPSLNEEPEVLNLERYFRAEILQNCSKSLRPLNSSPDPQAKQKASSRSTRQSARLNPPAETAPSRRGQEGTDSET